MESEFFQLESNGTFDLLGTSQDSLPLIYSILLGAFANVLGHQMRI